MAFDEECGDGCGLAEKPTQRIGSFLLGFGSVLLVCGIFAVMTKNGSPSIEESEAGGLDNVPAISSSASMPMLDPPYGAEDFDVTYGASASSLPFVQKVNVGQLPYGHPDPSATYPKYDGFTLWVVEEFNEPIDLDTDPIWTYSDGGLTEGQVRFVRDAIKFENGMMVVEVSNRGLPQGSQCSHAEVGYVGHKPLTSGEFRTRYNMYRYGRYEGRFKAPSVKPGNTEINGNFISTMFVYRDAKFRHWREIDFEVTGDSPNAVTSNVLKADGTSSWSPGIQASMHGHPHGIHVRRDFHTYMFEWLPHKITWYIDGKVQRTHTGGHVGIPDLPTKIMMNLWIFTGGGFGGGAIRNNQYPFHSTYDWFRFYKWNGDKKYPCMAMDKSCLDSDDLFLASNNPCDGIEQQGTVNGRQPCKGVCTRKSMDMVTISDSAVDEAGDSTVNETAVVYETPAISSSAGMPMLDPPPSMADYDASYALSDARPPPVVKKVTPGKLPYGHPTPGFNYPKHNGFTLWVVEEFNEPIDLDTDPIWTYSDGGLTEGMVRFVKDAIKFKDGKMMVEVSNKGLHQGAQCSHAEVGFVSHKPLTSGEFRTRYNMYRYGRYEGRFKAPSVRPGNPDINGNYISTMFVYRDAKFRHWREIDFEVTADGPTAVTTNVLKADGTSSWNPGIQSSVHGQIRGIHVRRDFHEYVFEWLPTSITWYVDGKQQRVHKPGRGVGIPDLPTKVMMNLWIFTGGAFGGSQIKNNVYPMHSEYDWFRFYKWDGDKEYPCSSMDEKCLKSDDLYLASNNPCDGIEQQGKIGNKAPCKAVCTSR